MAFDLIALDLDDTLLDPEKRISGRGRRAIADAVRAGVRVVIASGRAYLGVVQFLKQLDLHEYTITTGGAVTMDPDGTVCARISIPKQTTHNVMQWAKARGIYFQTYADGGFMYPEWSNYTAGYEERNGFKGVLVPDLASRQDIDAGKLLFIGPPEDVDKWSKDVKADFPQLLIQKSHPTFLEISRADASKGDALRRLAEKLGIPREKILAIGDSEIDRSMIRYAGMGVAMKNADPDVIADADYVAESCTQDGAAKVIEEFVLGGR